MKNIYVVNQYSHEGPEFREWVEVVFENEEDAKKFCEERKNERISGYCNIGTRPKYDYDCHQVFESIDEYNTFRKKQDEEADAVMAKINTAHEFLHMSPPVDDDDDDFDFEEFFNDYFSSLFDDDED